VTIPETRKANRLIREKSPYLLQHAYNPVNWYAWSPEAFQKAQKEDKPIFLSKNSKNTPIFYKWGMNCERLFGII
jgi:uncharacterized protein YyaL (SSP411 family)